MDEGPITHPGVPEDQYHTLGRKTMWIFVLSRVQGAFAFLVIAVVLLIAGSQPSLASTSIGPVGRYLTLGGEACLVIFVVFFGIAFLVGWLIYKNYKFALGDDSLKIKRGILEKEEVAIPYRQIQDVDIERDLSFQMLGLSRIMILTAGHEDEAKPGDDDSEGILPALDKGLAEWMQAELLKRANVQKVTEERDDTPESSGQQKTA